MTHAHDNESEAEEVERRSTDRRSAWGDPRFFVPLLSQLIATIVSITIIVTVARADISNVKEKIAELRGQVTALESLTKTTIEQKDRLDAIDARLQKIESAVTVQQAAYNFNFTSRLVAVEVRAGIKPQNAQPAQP